MAKNLYEKALADLRDEQNENEVIEISDRSMERFFDFLDSSEQERYHEMEELAEKRRKWLRLFDRMQSEIANGDFSEALETFGLLSQEMELE